MLQYKIQTTRPAKPWRGLTLISVGVMLVLAAPVFAEQAQNSEPGFPLLSIAPVSEDELSVERGKENLNIEDVLLQLSNVNANANLENNTLTSQATGDNLVESGAFDGAAGVVFAVQNSGNHVIIQNTTLINVTMNP